MQQKIILASKSPRRAELLELAGISFEVVSSDIEEVDRETAEDTVLELAEEKARTVAAKCPKRTVLAADTVVALKNGTILGKPNDSQQAKEYLRVLSNDWHFVHSGFCILGKEKISQVVSTKVYFRAVESEEIDWYVGTGEADDKAGAYAIQGHAAGFISKIEGSYTSVVGLPLAEVLLALKTVRD